MKNSFPLCEPAPVKGSHRTDIWVVICKNYMPVVLGEGMSYYSTQATKEVQPCLLF